MRKKAFTLSEVLVTLTVIGIIMVITIPVLNNTKPNKDKVFFHKAIMSVQQGLYKIDLPTTDFDKTYWEEKGSSSFCEAVSGMMNTSGSVNCSASSSYEYPNFITTDGIRFWNFEGSFQENKRTVYVDRKFTSKELDKLGNHRDSYHSEPGLKMIIRYDGKVEIADNEEFEYENKLVHSFQDLS